MVRADNATPVKRYCVYLLRTSNGAFYCGYTADLKARIRLHNAGKGAKILRGGRPVSLAYSRGFQSKSAALRFEASLKKRSHAHKSRLSAGWSRRHSQLLS